MVTINQVDHVDLCDPHPSQVQILQTAHGAVEKTAQSRSHSVVRQIQSLQKGQKRQGLAEEIGCFWKTVLFSSERWDSVRLKTDQLDIPLQQKWASERQ